MSELPSNGETVRPVRPPLKSCFIADLVPNQRVTTAFLVKHKEVRLRKSGEPFLSLVLGDRTGDMEAKMWDNVEQVQDTFSRDDFVKVRGAVLVFRNRPQFQVHRLRRLDASEIDFADYLPTSRRDVEAMYQELQDEVRSIRDPHLRVLLQAILDDESIAARLKRAPAAKSLHHAYFGGLLEHICSLVNLNRLVSQNYPQLDHDFVLAGIILHDLGKVFELSYDRTFAYTTEGQLLGHMVLVLDVLHEKLRHLPDFPPRLRIALEHMIISHHGRHEFGSPKLPMFPEALALHYLDDLDSKMQSMDSLLTREATLEGDWTSYNSSLERPLLKLDRWLHPPSPASAADEEIALATAAGAENSGSADNGSSIPNAQAKAPAESALLAATPSLTPVASLEAMAEQLQSAFRGGKA
jgi:3'-5' exoribonuclease